MKKNENVRFLKNKDYTSSRGLIQVFGTNYLVMLARRKTFSSIGLFSALVSCLGCEVLQFSSRSTFLSALLRMYMSNFFRNGNFPDMIQIYLSISLKAIMAKEKQEVLKENFDLYFEFLWFNSFNG